MDEHWTESQWKYARHFFALFYRRISHLTRTRDTISVGSVTRKRKEKKSSVKVVCILVTGWHNMSEWSKKNSMNKIAMKIEWKTTTTTTFVDTKKTQRRFMLLLWFFMLENLIGTPLCVCACACWTLRDSSETFWRAKRNYSKLNNNDKTARTKNVTTQRTWWK